MTAKKHQKKQANKKPFKKRAKKLLEESLDHSSFLLRVPVAQLSSFLKICTVDACKITMSIKLSTTPAYSGFGRLSQTAPILLVAVNHQLEV